MVDTNSQARSITNRDGVFEQVQEIANIGGWEFDQQTNTVRWSEQLYRIHGIEQGSVECVEDALEWYHPDDRGQIETALDELLTTETGYDIEARIRRPDGERRWVRTRGEPWYDGGELRGAHGTFQDITDRKQREQKLELFREAVDQAGHGVVITDREGDIEYANPTYEEDTGYELGEILGKNPRFSKSGKHDAEFYEAMWETIQSGEIWKTENLINRRKSGELYHVDQTIAPITTDNGEITHFVGIESEITDLRLREQRLDVLNRILRHNLRNSMTVVQGHLSTIESVADDEVATHVETINSRIEHLISISDKVSTLQSLFDSEFDPGTTCEIASVIEPITTEFAAEYPAVSLTTTIEANVTVQCGHGIDTAITEALENAIVHNTADDPEVAVSVFQDDGDEPWVTVRIADNGPGIPTHEKEAMEIGEETAITHASSIGLWIIHWTVTASGGDVTITDNDPSGSIVDLRLPTGEQHPDSGAFGD